MSTRTSIHRALLALTLVMAMFASVLLSTTNADAQETEVTAEFLAFFTTPKGPVQGLRTAVLADTDFIRGNSEEERATWPGTQQVFDGFFTFVNRERVHRTGETSVTVTFNDGTTLSNVLALRDFSTSTYGQTTDRYLLDQSALDGRSLADVSDVTDVVDVEHDLNWDDLGFRATAIDGPAVPTLTTVLFSLVANQGGFADEDIVEMDPATGETTVLFDGSDVGLRRFDLKAFAELGDGSLLLSLNRDLTVDGVVAQRQDIVRFTPTSLGSDTAGSFSLFLDGSAVGLDTKGERIDAIEVISEDGDTVTLGISTVGGIRVDRFRGQDEDISLLTLTGTGAASAGTWSRYFDGSDIDLVERSEDVAAIAELDGELLFATNGTFVISASGPTGDANDTLFCLGFTSGDNTRCAPLTVGFSLSDAGLDGARIDGLAIR